MTDKAIVTQRGGGPARTGIMAAAADGLGLALDQELDSGALVQGDSEQLLALETQGFRVKLLRDTNLLRIGAHEIDIEAVAPAAAAAADAGPAGLPTTWTHHLVQLVSPPTEEWVAAIEGLGVDVVEPISAYGLFVVGDPARVQALAALAFVAWTGPFRPSYRMDASAEGLTGPARVTITVYPSSAGPEVADVLGQARATVIAEQEVAAAYGGTFAVFTAEVPAAQLSELAAHPSVRWIEHSPPFEALGEREAQIVAENLDGAAPPATGPTTGYQTWLGTVGLTGIGTTVAVVDTGVDANAANNATGHTDLRGRQVAFVDYTAGAVPTDTNGHGTHVAGIAVGNAATGQVETAAPADFLWGQGVAPQASYVTQNFLLANPQPTTATLIEDASGNGAQVMNNSWGVNNSPGSGYTTGSRTIDQGVRDADPGAGGLQPLVIVCSAGNDGGSDQSISNPHESKNDIVVGNSLTARPGTGFPGDDVRGIAGSSSRGPAIDGRILPTVVAPGTDVSSALSRTSATFVPIPGTGTPDPADPATLIDRYTFLSGTSMAAPAVSGACALLVDWWRQTRSGQVPSPALVKALLVNSAENLVGGQNWRALNRTPADKAAWSLEAGQVFRRTLAFVPDMVFEAGVTFTQVGSVAAVTAAGQWFFDGASNRLFVRTTGSTNPGVGGVPTLSARDTQPIPNMPNGHQGWGRVSLENILLQAPSSDRGPRLFTDQRHAFTANGQEHLIRVAPVDPGLPLRVSVAWSDAAGAAGSNPALVNDLDLEVTELATGNVFKGNVFNNGFSVTGGSFDDRNNVECVYVQAPAGTYEVRVLAAAITAPARPDQATPWQDFALVIENAEVPPTGPVSVVPVLDRSGSMVAYGYVDTTRTASKQFVGLLGIDDQLGVVSFGTTGNVEFPAGPPAFETITGQPVRDAASAAIDAIGFGGCTFTGDGIIQARDLLAPATGSGAIVLFSDGYDNKGCDAANPAEPSAADAAATLPAGLALHTCAMGPASDQAALSSLATGGGRYYYMPTIDDLFEIYNYIRGQVSGDAISVIASATASKSRVPVTVDALASSATFTVAWADPEFRFVTGQAKADGEVAIRLRGPGGKLLHPDASHVQRTVGDGFVVFRLDGPAVGRWFVEVSTVSKRHLRYTVGGFCDSPVKLAVTVLPGKVQAGTELTIGASAFVGDKSLGSVRATASIVAPAAGLLAVLRKHRDALAKLKPPASLAPDRLPPEVGSMAALSQQLVEAGKPSPFSTVTSELKLRPVPASQLDGLGLASLAPPGGGPTPGSSGVVAGRFGGTTEPGTYNVVVRATGVDPTTRTRFTRQQLVSVVVA